MRVVQKALTFDDVLLVPAHSRVLPREVSLKTRLTRKHRPEHPARVRRHGHGDRGAPGDRHRAGRRHRHRAQEHVARGAGRRSDQGQALRAGVLRDPITVAPSMTVRESSRCSAAQDLRLAVVNARQGGGHRHQPRPALRDPARPAGQDHHDAAAQARHRARRREPRRGDGAHAQAPPRARAGGGREIRAARPDHGQGHPQVNRASERLQGSRTASCAWARRSAWAKAPRSASKR